MSLKQLAALGASGAVLAAMIAGATTSGPRRIAPVPAADTRGIELQGAELAAEVTRLRERLRPTTEPQQPARNLFQFGGRAAAPDPAVDAAPAFTAALAAAPPATPPALTLIGLATDSGPDGPLRTAIISGFGDLFLVREGDQVTAQYRVAAIGPQGVELTSVADGASLRLLLP